MESTTKFGPSPASGSGSGWTGLFGRLVLFFLRILSSVLYFVTITLPSLLFSTSLTVTMNATTLTLILVGLAAGVAWLVRYRLLNKYSRLPPEPQRKEPEIDMFPGGTEESTKSGLSGYLDEFLSAIKIFGYLERPVFHELTRSMQTRKLIAGEMFDLEQEKGFCIVVDGLVDIFVKSGQQSTKCHTHDGPGFDFSSGDDESESGLRYQLLTEVRNGAPMSSLFSIMSLFTEDVNLGGGEDDASVHAHEHGPNESGYLKRHGGTFPRNSGLGFRPPSNMYSTGKSILETSAPRLHFENQCATRLHTPSQAANQPDNVESGRIPSMSLDESAAKDEPPKYDARRPSLSRRALSTSAHPDIIARATVDTTIAIIPASAFRRLIKIYPKATAHIVHVILSRFQRVTLATAYNYLGLAGEVLQTEKNMIRYTMCQLPNMLRGEPLARLKEKFTRERDRAGEDEKGKGIALHNAAAVRTPNDSRTSLHKEATIQSRAKHRPLTLVGGMKSGSRERSTSHSPSPGDLLTNIQLARGGGRRASGTHQFSSTVPEAPKMDTSSPLAHRTFDPFEGQKRPSFSHRDSLDDDNVFRVSVLECMFKALGFGASGSNLREAESKEGSPMMVSSDQKKSTAVFSNPTPGIGNTSNAFGFLGQLDGADGDSESMASGSIAVGVQPNAHSLATDMKDELEIVFFPKGSVLIEQGERNPGLYYVIDGFLDMATSNDESPGDILAQGERLSFHLDPFATSTASSPMQASAFDFDVTDSDGRTASGRKKSRRSVALIKPGGLAGYIGSVSSYRSFIDVVAKTDVFVGFLPRMSLERIVDRYPIALLTMAKRLTSLLPRLILHIDFALEWVQVNAGEVLFHEDEESEAIFIVLNGRLRLVTDKEGGGVKSRAEFGQGESIGELEVLTESTRPGTLHAIRDTELVKFPRTLFNSLAQEHPGITIKISKIIASRMRTLVDDPSKFMVKDMQMPSKTAFKKGSSTVNLRTVAILPVRSGVPVVEFGTRLMAALSQVGPPNGATSLNQAAIMNHLGKNAFNKIGKLRLSQYLADLEEKYSLVVYVADTNVNSPWTQTCISQADSILVVGLAEGSPEIGEYERFMLGTMSTARKSLVLVHTERYSTPGLTRSWLRNRSWINGSHYHVQMAFEAASMPTHPPAMRLGTAIKHRVQVLQAEIQKYTMKKSRHSRPVYSPEAPYKGDFHRLARRLCGKSVGLVLGGGGARGLSQIGIIMAMEEAGIPIDMVGGTSIGAFIGALYARHADVVPIFGLAKKFAGRMASMWRFALDLTYPSVSYTTGHEFNRGIFKTFHNTQMEDFWLEYYCNTTNISKSRSEFHTSGYAWRYIRASMSLAGLLPPLCDEGDMLLDGGYVDNLTVSHMKWLGADVIFAVDVGAIDDNTPQEFGDSLSGIWTIINRWNPFSWRPNPPTLAEIQARLAYVSSVDALERAKAMPGCLYMRPPIDAYGTLDFGKFDEIYRVGYAYGKEYIQDLRAKGIVPLVEETAAKRALKRTMAPRRASI